MIYFCIIFVKQSKVSISVQVGQHKQQYQYMCDMTLSADEVSRIQIFFYYFNSWTDCCEIFDRP